MFRDAVPEANPAFATSIGDIVFIREHPGIPLSRLPQMGMIPRQAAEHYRDRDTPVHARHDVVWTEIVPNG